MANDELINSIARDYGLPVQDRFGRFQVGGPLGGHAGVLDRLFDIAPGIGDIRALSRGAKAGTKTRIKPDLMGGVKAEAVRPGEAAFEIGTALPVVGDAGTAAKLIGGVLADYGLLGGLGKIVFHGSPHRFAPEPDFPLGRFRHEFMGSGEGNQAYGWGTYLADRKSTAQTYAEGLDPSNQNFTGANLIKTGKETSNIYTVDLPDEHIEKMLDWDAPFSDQPDAVKKAISSIGGKRTRMLFDNPDFLEGTQAGTVYQNLARDLGSQQAASEALAQAGIPGIKYWDGGSRSAGSGTRNYVVFDENIMTVLSRNDEASRMARVFEDSPL